MSHRTVTGPARLLAAVALLVGALAPSPALAHARLTKSAPAARARLAAPPGEIVLWFSLAPEPTFTRIALLRADSTPIRVGAAERLAGAPLAVRVAILDTLEAGSYEVRWQSAVADGHPLRGRFTFVVTASPRGSITLGGGRAADSAPALGMPSDTSAHQHHASTAPDADQRPRAEAGAATPAAVLLRTLQLGALLAVIGAVVFSQLVLRSARAALGDDDAVARNAARRAAGVGIVGALLLALANAGRLLQETRALLGPDAGAAVGDVLTTTRWGLGWVLQTAAIVVAVVGLLRARTARSDGAQRAGWTLASVAGAALAFTPALTGHAAAMGSLAPVAIMADGFHVIGGGGWLGTLLVLAAAGLPAARLAGERRGRATAALLGAFSPLALVFAATIALSGLVSAVIHMGPVQNLWTTRYGRTLLLKVAAVGLVAAVGAFNWKRVLPELPSDAAADRLRKTAAAELAASALVVLLTALLTATEPGV